MSNIFVSFNSQRSYLIKSVTVCFTSFKNNLSIVILFEGRLKLYLLLLLVPKMKAGHKIFTVGPLLSQSSLWESKGCHSDSDSYYAICYTEE